MGRKVLIAGYYGFGNAGDEAILTAMLSSMRALRPGLEFIVVSGNPEETAQKYDVSSVLYTDLQGILETARRSDLVILGGGGLFQDYWGANPATLLTRHSSGIS